MIRVRPAAGQNASDVARILGAVAAEQGVTGVHVQGSEVVVPRSLRLRSSALSGFPPRGDMYQLATPIELDGTGPGATVVARPPVGDARA